MKYITLWIMMLLFLASCSDLPVDDASSRALRPGKLSIYAFDNKPFDVVIYYFNGHGVVSEREMLNSALLCVFRNLSGVKKAEVIVVLCDVNSVSKINSDVYPYGCYLIKEKIMKVEDVAEVAKTIDIIKAPMQYDDRINSWIFNTGKDKDASMPIITELESVNNNITKISRNSLMQLSSVASRSGLEGVCGMPDYSVLEDGLRSYVYKVQCDGSVGTVRVWYSGDEVKKINYYFS